MPPPFNLVNVICGTSIHTLINCHVTTSIVNLASFIITFLFTRFPHNSISCHMLTCLYSRHTPSCLTWLHMFSIFHPWPPISMFCYKLTCLCYLCICYLVHWAMLLQFIRQWWIKDSHGSQCQMLNMVDNMAIINIVSCSSWDGQSFFWFG